MPHRSIVTLCIKKKLHALCFKNWYFTLLYEMSLRDYCLKRNFNQFCEELVLHYNASRGMTLLGTFHISFFRAKATQAVI